MSSGNKVSELLLIIAKFKEIVLGGPQYGSCPAYRAVGIYQVGGLISAAANLTGIAVLVFGFALWACATNKPVRQGHFAVFTIGLFDVSCNDRAGFIQTIEDQFAEIFIFRRVGRVKIIVFDMKIIEILFVLFVHSLDKLFGAYACCSGAYHNRCAVSVVRPKVKALVAA
jgi:hypothetical protein